MPLIEELFRRVRERNDYRLTVDLIAGTVSDDTGWSTLLSVDAAVRTRLMEGLDDIDLTLRYEREITAFELRR